MLRTHLILKLIPLTFILHWLPDSATLGVTYHFHEIPAPVIQQAPTQPQSSPIPPYLLCVRFRESTDNYEWGYPTGTGDGGGAYQFERSTWDSVEPDPLYGNASAVIQDQAAEALFARDGKSPWSDDGC